MLFMEMRGKIDKNLQIMTYAPSLWWNNRQTDRHIDRQTDRQTDKGNKLQLPFGSVVLVFIALLWDIIITEWAWDWLISLW